MLVVEPPLIIFVKTGDMCRDKYGTKFLLRGGLNDQFYREILRLSAQGISQRSIARSCDCSRNTVARVIAQAQAERSSIRVRFRALTDGELSNLFFPNQIQPDSRKAPDLRVHPPEMVQEWGHPQLLWHEYCEQVSGLIMKFLSNYTQYCYHYAPGSQSLIKLPCNQSQTRRTDRSRLGRGKLQLSLTAIRGKIYPSLHLCRSLILQPICCM